MSSTAFLISKRYTGGGEGQWCYRCAPPLDGQEYVVVSAAITSSGPETYIFAGNANGTITDWLELDGSFTGALDHERALGNAGYTTKAAA